MSALTPDQIRRYREEGCLVVENAVGAALLDRLRADFDGWVQERGLYFPDKWDEHFVAILACNDNGEQPKKGVLLVAKYGKGHYIYTGLSFFRELPAGVPGAYRLFANMVSIGK